MIVEDDCLILQIFQMSDRETREEVPMNVMIHQQAEHEAQRMQANREELVERIGRAMREDGTVQPLQGLHLSRSSVPLKPVHSVVEPSVCVIAQGSKEVPSGREPLSLRPLHSICWPLSSCHASARFSKHRKSGHTSVCAWSLPLASSVRSWLEAGYASPREIC